MERGLIEHRAFGSECYALDADTLVISIKTGYEVDKVILNYGDPFANGIMGAEQQWSGSQAEHTECVKLPYQKLWTFEVTPEFHRCKYFFEIYSGGECVRCYEDGIFDIREPFAEGKIEQCFYFPWMNPADIGTVPDWVCDTVWYQIFPDRFCNGEPDISPEGAKEWKYEKVQHFDYYGGDLQGIIDKIPYLKDLGITGIYLNPIFESNSNHKYNTADYCKIDPHFGTEETLIKLVELAHQAGIRIMLDAVFNHCGRDFAPWKDVLENGPKSRYYDWFFIHQWPFDQSSYDTRDGKFDSFAFHAGMPKLNTNHPDVIAYFNRICVYWVKQWKIDGIRFDVGNEVSHFFLKELRKAVKEVNPQVYLLGEIWHDSISWLMGDEYDSVMNYPFVQSMHNFFIDERKNALDFECEMNRCYHLYGKQYNRVLFNLLDSHDTIRLYSRLSSIDKFYQYLTILFTMQGTPCIYYGTEIAMAGGFDPDCRRCMPWDAIQQGKYEEQIHKMKTLIRLRQESDACKSEQLVWDDKNDSRVIHYQKVGTSDLLDVYVNASTENYLLEEKGKLVFAQKYKSNVLEKDGVCIFQTKR